MTTATANTSTPIAPRFLPSGDTALVVEFGQTIDRHISALVLALAQRIDDAKLDGVVETVPTFRSLMVHYNPLRLPQAKLKEHLVKFLDGLKPANAAGRLWRIPACYDLSVAPDLEEVAERTGVPMNEVIDIHTSILFHVYMIGFLPGYGYLGDLPQKLALPRRQSPRVKVPMGSVAIAMTMSQVYALESPGGWHLIGRTPVPFWDQRREEPVLLRPGDKIRFEPMSLADYERLKAKVEAGPLDIQPEPVPAEA